MSPNVNTQYKIEHTNHINQMIVLREVITLDSTRKIPAKLIMHTNLETPIAKMGWITGNAGVATCKMILGVQIFMGEGGTATSHNIKA